VAAPEFAPRLRDSLAEADLTPRVLGTGDVAGYCAHAPALDRPIQPWDPVSLALTCPWCT